MSQSTETSPKTPTAPLELTVAAVNYLIKILPKGTAYCIGIVLVVMMNGRLVQFIWQSGKSRSSLSVPSDR